MPVPTQNHETTWSYVSNYTPPGGLPTGLPAVIIQCVISGTTYTYALTNVANVGAPGSGALTDPFPGALHRILVYNFLGNPIGHTVGVAGSDGYVYYQLNVTAPPPGTMVGNFTSSSANVYEFGIASGLLAVCQGGTTWNALQVQ